MSAPLLYRIAIDIFFFRFVHKTRYVQIVRKELDSPKKNRLCAWRLAPAAFVWKLISLGRKIYFPKPVARHCFCQAANYQENCHLTRMIHKNFTAKRDDGKIFARRRSDWQGFGLFMSLAQSVDEQGGCRKHFRWKLAAVICARHCYRFFRSFQAVLGLGKEIWMCVSRNSGGGPCKTVFCAGFMRKILIFHFFSFAFILVTEIRREARLKVVQRRLLPFPRDFRIRFRSR